MNHLLKLSYFCLLGLTSAGDGCKPGRNCVCHNDPSYYTSEECYSENNPWGGTSQRPLRSLPDSPTKQDIKLECYGPEDPDNYELLKLQKDSSDPYLPFNFNFNRETIIITHGFIDNGENTRGWCVHMKDAYYKQSQYTDYNVCILDWSKGANVGTFNLDYPKAAQNTRVVGDVTGQLINWLDETYNYGPENFICIGHSLGAHVCGYAGKAVNKLNSKNKQLKRISGMDPAGPYFEFTEDFVRLDKSDATFVDSMHTDGQKLTQLGFGMLQAISDIDFYPSGGYDQPGCRSILISCSHSKSHEYFIQSIIDGGCDGFPCEGGHDAWENGECRSCGDDGCVKMGWLADLGWSGSSAAGGEYYLDVEKKAPYCSA